MVNHYFDLNVLSCEACFSFISITYYFWMATVVVLVNHLAEVFDLSQFVDLLAFESFKPFKLFSHFKSKWWKPTLFQPPYYKGKEIMSDFKGRDVEIMKFGLRINTQTGSGYFNEAEASTSANRDWELYGSTQSSNSFNTPNTMTPLFQSQNELPLRSSNLTEEEWATWGQIKSHTSDHLRSSNLDCLPRNSKDSSAYSHLLTILVMQL